MTWASRCPWTGAAGDRQRWPATAFQPGPRIWRRQTSATARGRVTVGILARADEAGVADGFGRARWRRDVAVRVDALGKEVDAGDAGGPEDFQLGVLVRYMPLARRPRARTAGVGWRSKYQKARSRPRSRARSAGSPARMAWRVSSTKSGAKPSTSARTARPARGPAHRAHPTTFTSRLSCPRARAARTIEASVLCAPPAPSTATRMRQV